MELSVLLDPSITLQDWTELPLKVTLSRHKNLTFCSLLPKGRLGLTTFTSGTTHGTHTQLDGPFTQVLCEDENHETVLDQNPRLLTLGQNNDIRVSEVCTADGQVTLTTLCLCDEHFLRQVCARNNFYVRSFSSVRLLSLRGDDLFILLSGTIFVHLCYSGKNWTPRLVSSLSLDLHPETTQHISDACFRHEILFLLDNLGFIYAFDTIDGSLVANIELPTTDVDAAEPLKSICVSPNLDLIVVSSSSSCFLALRLSENVRENIILAIQTWRSERSSKTSLWDETQGSAFQTDRSWDATLLSLLYKTKSCPDFPMRHQAASLQSGNVLSGARFTWTVVGGGWVKANKDDSGNSSLHIWSVSPCSALLYILQKDGCATLLHWDVDTQGVTYHALGKAVCVYSGDHEASLVITDRGLSLIIFSVTQNEFLTRLMIHGSASTADILCHLNNWERCSVPIHTLEAGLDNRQLDTVDFFLKSKETILSSISLDGSGVHSQLYLYNVQDLVPALELLYSYIHGTDQEAQSKHFSEQLLQLTLTFLNAQLVSLCNLQSDPDPGLQQCVGILTGYIAKLRPFMKKFHQQPLHVKAGHAERRPGAWEKMSLENIISDAIMKNCIPEAQAFLREQGHHPSSLTWLRRKGLKLVYRCLLGTRVAEAFQLLQNMGFSIWDELHRICLHTSDPGIRTLLVNLLQKEGLLPEQQQQAIQTVCKLEELYGNVYQTTQERRNVVNSRSSWRSCATSHEVKTLQEALTPQRDKPEILLLHWAKDWDSETQELLLLPWKKSRDMSVVTPKILWRHLTLWHEWTQIASWIESTGQSQGMEDKERPLWPLLSPVVIDEDTLCCSYTREKILDKLSRMNIFIPSEVNDYEHFMERLAISRRLMDPAGSSSQHPDVHDRFVVLCIERGLQYLLYTYLDCHRLNPDTCSALASTALHESYPWFDFLVCIRQVSERADAERMFQVSLSNARMLMPDCQPSVNNMLLDGHTLLALATIMFAPGGVDGVLKQCEEPSLCQWNVDLPLLKMALTPYPKLRAALFSQHQSNCGSPTDITLYHLLQELSPFNPARFFTWQPTNSLAASDASTAVPHCSCTKLVKKLSVVEQLDTFYYLRSGRPAVAFSTFLVHRLLKSKVPKQQIHQTAEDVYALALAFFNVPIIISSCVCFLELLGLSSYKLRVDVNVANVILQHSSSLQEEAGHNTHVQALAQRLTNLVENEVEAAKDLLLSLEEVVDAHLQQETSPLPPHSLWVTVVQFCLLHDIPMSTSYLKYCVQRQDWLQLLVHANSPDQVFYVYSDLNPVLRSHISLAFQDKVPYDCFLQRIGSDTKVDSLHHMLLKCLSMGEPGQILLKKSMQWKVPLFSVLAASTQDTDVISCLCAWIVTSVDAATYTEITHTVSDSVDHEWSLEDLAMIWDILLRRMDSSTLQKAFSKFMEDCPLLVLLEMYELCLLHKNYTQAQHKVVEFQNSLTNLQSVDCPSAAPIPVLWLEAQASHLLQLLLLQSRIPYVLQKVMQLLCESSVCQNLCGGLDIPKLTALCDILEDHPTVISQQLFRDYSPAAFQEECQRLLPILIKSSRFSLAHRVAELAELPTDNLIIEEVLQDQHHLQEIGQWDCPQARAQYWRNCHVSFCNKQLSPPVGANFFQSQSPRHTATSTIIAEQMEALAEQELLSILAGHWLSLDKSTSLRTLEELEQQIWKYRIEKEILNRTSGLWLPSSLSVFTNLSSEFSFSGLPALNPLRLLDLSSLPPLHGINPPTKESVNSRILSGLIDRLLDDSKVHEASRVCRYFQLSHRDVWLVLSCRALASGELTINQLHPDIQNVITEGKDTQERKLIHRRRFSSSRMGSTSSQTPTNPIVIYLEVLKNACAHGKNFCKQLLCMCELSQDLGCSFSEVSSRDPSDVLRTLLSSRCPEFCDRAHAVIASHGLSSETVARIVSEESLSKWRTLHKEGDQSAVYNVSERRSNFFQLARLCPDPTLVGLYLLDQLEAVPLAELPCIIEVLISAHDCFSLTCHLEGIWSVLQACRHLIEMHLAVKQEYSLMVRLLTGIGRYNDMVYVFDILHKNQHFEILLRKQLDTTGELQTAILEYIKRHHPGDSEKHNMTALCFSLHRDIGHNHEHAAKIQLRLIQSRPWEYWMSDLAELIASIMKALTLLIDADESYSKESCVRQSLHSGRLTRLLTLQLHLLNSGQQTKLINLERENLVEPILALPRVYQAVIVTEAYELQPDWASVLYSKVIVGGDFQYLEEFKQRKRLGSGVLERLSTKCRVNSPGATGLQNLKRVISCCEDINSRYKLAFENKFYDITDVLMRDSQTRCCLTDALSR